ncbi:MAG TPA: anhydro-N-acetylmuramic acid kinase, partial [Candidatus Saccharimonadales bacterium]|nr:anhydro-N-acetylmuramic acid kinase [Candidatus Saccharimonadales bacterium]
MSAPGRERGFRVLGLMSGTSCDGVTVAGAAFHGAPAAPRMRCLNVVQAAYPRALREQLLRAAAPGGADAGEVAALHVGLAELWARAAARCAG